MAISPVKFNQFVEKVDSQLSSLKATVERIATVQDEMAKSLEMNTKLLTGDGEPEKGVIVRLDRIEEDEKSRRFWYRSAVVAAIGSIVSVVYNKLKGL